MYCRIALLVSLSALGLGAQTVCQPTPAYSPCEITFELSAAEMTAHPHPYRTVDLEAEFRSPRFHTFRMPAFWDGGNRMAGHSLAERLVPIRAGAPPREVFDRPSIQHLAHNGGATTRAIGRELGSHQQFGKITHVVQAGSRRERRGR